MQHVGPPDRAPVGSCDAIVLVGGAGSRLGGVDKAAVDLVGRPLLSRPLDAVRHARTLVIVGQTSAQVPRRAVRVTEDPPGGGPAAATAAGVRAITGPAPWTYLVACDLPGAARAVRLLDAADLGDADGVVLVEPGGHRQWLLGRYRSAALRAAVARTADPSGRSMRELLAGLRLVELPAGEEICRDVDTWDDHARWARILAGEPGRPAD